MIKLTSHQWRLLHACATRAQRSTATIQNTARALVRLALVERYTSRGTVYLMLTDAGRKEWFEQMRSRQSAQRA